jgi:membrane protein implicated in regulation of membrane protease activity
MELLLVFVISLLVLESIAVGIGLLVERHTTPYSGLVAFIGCYFAMIWLAWRFSVRVTKPRSRLKSPEDANPRGHDGGERSAVLLGAYVAADDLWSQSTLLALGV